MSEKPSAPATERNRDAILEVLRDELREFSTVLEIGSGTGQHAVYFSDMMPWLDWQTSDRLVNHAGIDAWIAESSLRNVRRPLDLDVQAPSPLTEVYDAVFSANTAHIMSFAAVVCMFELVGRLLRLDGVFCLYGPFNLEGKFTSASNETFDRSLRSQDPNMGIRDLESLQELGRDNRMQLLRRYAMPANNMLLVWTRSDQSEGVGRDEA
ncbi:MAG: DUF938 domain-containing protein [Woeseiaceae bacterium]